MLVPKDWDQHLDSSEWSLGDDGLPFRTAARVLVVTRDADMLLLVGHDAANPDHTWVFTPGGGLRPGEDPRAGAVRELAEESGNAAKEVSKLIRELQERSGGSLSATKEMAQNLSELLTSAEAVDKELQGVLSATNHLNDSIQNVAAVSEEQAASAEEMTASVQGVTNSIGEIVGVQKEIGQAAAGTTDAAKNIEQASRSMAETVEQLSELIGRFKTEPDGRGLALRR